MKVIKEMRNNCILGTIIHKCIIRMLKADMEQTSSISAYFVVKWNLDAI